MRHGGVIILGVIALNLPCNAHIQNTAFENKMEVRSTQRDDSETGLFEKVALPNYETRDLSTDSTVPTVAPWWNVLRNGPGSQATTQAPFQQPTTRKPTKMPITKAPLTPRQTNTFTTKAPSVPAPQYLPPFFTFPPVAKPVTGPTSSPIKAPVAKPTKAPTKAPVAKPTHAPTKVPLVKPISAPTMAPVAKPTSAPIKAPHVKPTNAPTKAPVVKPTGAPIHAPVVKPTSAPIIKPSSSPIKAPILKPTSVPIKAPISKPTGAPNKAPISSITGAPVKITSSPSEKPSFLPATPPTGALPSPGRSPSSAPAQPTVQGTPVDVVIKNINIVFSNVSQLSDAETVQFELVTDTWFNEFYATMRRRVLRNSRGLQRDLVKNMNSTIMFQKQQVISGNNTITYDQRLNYTALPGASSSSEYVTLPFPDMKANTDYRNRLMTNITAFAKVGAPIMIPIIGDMSAPSPVPSSDSKSLSSGAIGGIVVAAVAVFGIIGYIAYVNVKKKELARASPNAVAALTASSKGDLHAQQQETSAPIADDRINNRVVGETSTLGGQDSASYKDDAASYKDDNASYAGKRYV